jgi:hypothetical protein
MHRLGGEVIRNFFQPSFHDSPDSRDGKEQAAAGSVHARKRQLAARRRPREDLAGVSRQAGRKGGWGAICSWCAGV